MKYGTLVAVYAFTLLGMILFLLFSEPIPPPDHGAPVAPLWKDAAFLSALEKSGKRGIGGIAIIAPASGLRGGNIADAHAIAEEIGFALPREAIDPTRVPYTANEDDVRLELLRKALADPEVEVLWALRGGYGASRLLPALAETPPPDTPKVFVGYSDMTFLHLFFQRWNWRTVHADMFWELTAADNGKDPRNFRLLASLLAGEVEELRYDGLKPFNQAARAVSGPVEGSVTGGNLTCLAAAVGTPWSPDPSDGILFLEDVKERGYKIDRMLTQLSAAGVVDRAKAVVLGSFTRGDDDTEYALERFARECDKPVFRTDQFGHGEKNYPLVFNSPAAIERAEGGDDLFILRIEARLLP